MVSLKQYFNKLNPLGLVAFIGLCFVMMMHFFASVFYLYWQFWWLDIVMHILGGFLVVLVIICFSKMISFYDQFTLEKKFFFVFFWLFLVTVFWELFEFFLEKVDPTIGYAYWIDTFSDIVAGLLGGVLSFIFVYVFLKNKKHHY